MTCSFCNVPLEFDVEEYSISNYNAPLCRDHQHWFKKSLKEDHNTKFVLWLYLRLKELGAKPFLNLKDGHKTVDIAIQHAKIHIEVDGCQHNLQSNQAMRDLQRTFHDLEKDIYTIRIPNSLVKDNLFECADYLMRIIELRKGYSMVTRKKKRKVQL